MLVKSFYVFMFLALGTTGLGLAAMWIWAAPQGSRPWWDKLILRSTAFVVGVVAIASLILALLVFNENSSTFE